MALELRDVAFGVEREDEAAALGGGAEAPRVCCRA